MAKKTKKKRGGRMSHFDRMANSSIATVLNRLRKAGYATNGVKHKQLIRMYAEWKGLTIPEGANLKNWIIKTLGRTKLVGKRNKTKRTLTLAQQYAKENRQKMTPAAKRFRLLIGNARIGVKTEYMIKNDHSFYLIDFYIPSANLCVEIDGGYHDEPEQQEYDRKRDQFLTSKGYKVVRIPNEQMMKLTTIELRELLGI